MGEGCPTGPLQWASGTPVGAAGLSPNPLSHPLPASGSWENCGFRWGWGWEDWGALSDQDIPPFLPSFSQHQGKGPLLSQPTTTGHQSPTFLLDHLGHVRTQV